MPIGTTDPNARQVFGQVGTAPSPASSGVDWHIDHLLDYFANPLEQTVPFKVVVYPRGEQPTKQNSEVILVQAYASSTRVGSIAISEVVAGHAADASVDVRETQAGDAGVPQSCIQQLTIDATAGTFTLIFNGGTTSTIAWNATPATIQAALVALSQIGAGNCVVYFVTPPLPGVVEALPSLKLYWRLGEAAGATTVADSSGSGNTGTVAAGVTLGQAGLVVGDPTTCALFSNASTARIAAAAYAPYAVGSSRTFFGVANRTGHADADVLISGSASTSPDLQLASASQNVQWFANGSSVVTWTAAWPGDGQVVYWALTYNDTSRVAELFINGVSQGTKTVTAGQGYTAGGAAAPIRVGATGSATNPFNGTMQEVGVAETILTAAQILSIYTNGTAGAGTTPAPCTLNFKGTLANAAQPLTTADATNLTTGAAGSATIAETTLGAIGVNEVQTITLVGTSGTFTLTFGGQTTNALPFNATADAVSTELQALSSIGSGNVSVEGGSTGPYTVTFQGTLAGAAQALITTDATLLVMNGEAERQVIGIDADGGTFRLSADAGVNYTAALAYNASAATVQTALQGLAAIGSGNCNVTYDTVAGLYVVTWCGAKATSEPALLTVDASSLTLTTSHVTACVRAQDGTTARSIVVGDHVEAAVLPDVAIVYATLTGGTVYNDFAPSGYASAGRIHLTVTGVGAAILTGLAGGTDGRLARVICHAGELQLMNKDTRSTAANQFQLMTPDGTPNIGSYVKLNGDRGHTEAIDLLYGAVSANELVAGWKEQGRVSVLVAPTVYGMTNTLTYAATVAVNAVKAPWQTVTVTNGTAYTIGLPTNPPDSDQTGELVVEVINGSGGVLGAATWNAIYRFNGFTWTNPANTKARFAVFQWNGAAWICTSLSTADYTPT